MSAIQNDPIYLLPHLYLNGLNISIASTTVLAIAPGMCRDSQNVIDIEVGYPNLQEITAPATQFQGYIPGLLINGAINGAGSPQQLAHGISVALYNTAFGLLIAIPALAAWRGLKAIATQRQRECEEFTRQLFKKLYLTDLSQ